MNTGKLQNVDLGRSGFTLVEALVSIFILSIISLVIAASMNSANTQLKNVQIKSAKMDLNASMRFNASDFMSLYNSSQMPQNKTLKDCMQGASEAACTNNQDIEFNFYGAIRDVPVKDSSGNITSFNAPLVGGVSTLSCPSVGSTDLTPVFYTADGVLCSCTDAASKCPLQLVSKFAAFCSVGLTCKYPVGFRISYETKIRPDVPENIKITLASSSGSFFVPFSDNSNYLKYTYAGAYYVDPAGIESLKYSAGEYDIRQGNIVQFISPSIIRMSLAFASPVSIAAVELYSYTYPTGCSASSVGTTLSDGTNCMPPLDSQYVYVKTLSSISMNSGIVSAESTIGSNVVVEYKVKSFDAAHNMIGINRTPLRAAFSLEGSLSVVPPVNGLYFVCDPADTTTNAFQFKVTDTIGGWKSFSATISPPLPDGTTVLPGFSAQFDPTKTSTQSINVDVTKFPAAGGNYTLTFQGITSKNEIKSVSTTFKVNPVPQNTATIISPAVNAKVRASSDLNVVTNVKLSCGRSVKAASFSLLESGNPVMASPQDIASDCVKESSGTADQISYTCSHVFPCTTWLNVSDASLCPAKYSTTTTLTAKLDVADDAAKAISATPNSFLVSPKISIWVGKGSTQFLNFNYTGNITIQPPPTTRLNFLLSSTLLTGETITFALNGTNYACKQAGGGSAYYGNFVYEYITDNYGSSTTTRAYYLGPACYIDLPTPALSPGAIQEYQLTSSDPTVEVLSPSKVTFKSVDPAILSCNAPDSGAPICGAGQTLQTKLTKIGFPYDSQDWAIAKADTSYTLQDNAKSNLDFFIYYKPSSITKDPVPVISINFLIPNSTDQIVSTASFTDSMSRCSQASPISCEANMSRIKTDFFNSKRLYLTTAGMIVTAFPYSPASANVNYQFMIMRECYCQ